MKIKTTLWLVALIAVSHSLTAIPQITAVTPTNGPREGGTVVTISGSDFVGVTQVVIGPTSVPFTVIDSSHIQVTTPLSVPGVEIVSVVAVSGTSPLNHPADYFTFTGHWHALVPDFNAGNPSNVYVFDEQLSALIAVIPLGSGGEQIVITQGGRFAFVANATANQIGVIDVVTSTAIGIINDPSLNFPICIAITPDNSQLYVVNYLGNTCTVLMNPTTTLNPVANVIPVGTNPTCVAITPDGTKAFVTNVHSSSITQIDTTSHIPTTFSTGPGTNPAWMAITPDQSLGLILDTSEAAPTQGKVIPVTNLTGIPAFGVPIQPYLLFAPNFFPQVAITSNGQIAYFTDTGNASVSSLTLPLLIPGPSYAVGTTPNGLSLTPDGAMGYVSDGASNDITVITFGPPPSIDVVGIGNTPTNPAITPDQSPVAYFTPTVLLGGVVAFDAAASLSPVGSIALYQWDFGDGSPVVTVGTPLVNHTYAAPGVYTVTLTVTNTAGTSTTFLWASQLASNVGGPPAVLSLDVVVSLLPPSDTTITQSSDRFLTQTCYDNTIRWTTPVGIVPVLYLIYLDSSLTKLVGQVPADGPLVFTICSRRPHTTYYLVSVDALGNRSAPVAITS